MSELFIAQGEGTQQQLIDSERRSNRAIKDEFKRLLKDQHSSLMEQWNRERQNDREYI